MVERSHLYPIGSGSIPRLCVKGKNLDLVYAAYLLSNQSLGKSMGVQDPEKKALRKLLAWTCHLQARKTTYIAIHGHSHTWSPIKSHTCIAVHSEIYIAM